MRNFLTNLSWTLLLVVIGLVLIFYNFNYLPAREKILRLQQEIKMWTERVNELTDSLQTLSTGKDTAFNVSYRFDELFISAESLKISPPGETILRSLLPNLRGAATIEVIGHTDTRNSPTTRWSSSWDYSASAAAVVARRLITLGVPAQKIIVVGAGDTRPLVAKTTHSAAVINRRIEIAVRTR